MPSHVPLQARASSGFPFYFAHSVLSFPRSLTPFHFGVASLLPHRLRERIDVCMCVCELYFIITHNIQNMLLFSAAFYPCVLKMKREIGKSTCAPHSARDGDIFPCGSGLRTRTRTKLWRAFADSLHLCMYFARNGHQREIFVFFLFSFFFSFVEARLQFLDIAFWVHGRLSIVASTTQPFLNNLQIIIISVFLNPNLDCSFDGRWTVVRSPNFGRVARFKIATVSILC